MVFLVERKADDSGPARAGCHSGNGEPRVRGPAMCRKLARFRRIDSRMQQFSLFHFLLIGFR
jgi:hypothetical protein